MLICLNDTSFYDMVMSFPWQNLIWFLGLHSWCLDHIFWWCIYVPYMLIFIRIRRITRLEYTTSLLDDNSLICWCCHMHKDHIIQLWCRIPTVLSSHMIEDCCLSSKFGRYIVLYTVWWIHGWLFKFHIVVWRREWCYRRLHGDITIQRHDLLNHFDFLPYDDRLMLTYVYYHG